MSEEYGVPDAEKIETTRGSKKQAHQFNIGAEIGKSKEDDAHLRMNRAPFAAERGCKPVTMDGKDGR